MISLNIIGALQEGELRLATAGVLRPRRHAEILLGKALGLNRSELYLHAQRQLTEEECDQYRQLLTRRENGEPVQYITGWTPFYKYDFIVGRGVFIPRFDTEVMVERVVEDINTNHPDEIKVLDLCCGCGAIGLSITTEVERARAVLLDHSPTALEYSRLNAEKLDVQDRVDIVNMNALDAFPAEWTNKFDYICANPPYIPLGMVNALPRDVREGEPRDALTDFGDGMHFYQIWAKTVPPILNHQGKFLLEIGDGAEDQVVQILSENLCIKDVHRDLSGALRVVECERN